MGVPAGQGAGSQVYDDDAELVLHAFDWNVLLQATGDLADFSITNIYLLIVEFLAIWVLLYPNNFSDPYIDFREIMQITGSSLLRRSSLGLLSLLLLISTFLLFIPCFLLLLASWSFSSILLLLFLLFLWFLLLFSCTLSPSFCFLFLLFLGFFELFEFLELRGRWLGLAGVREGHKEAQALYQFVKTWKMLNVV